MLSAARELFSTRGIKGVSVDEVAEMAQTNKMTLYRHFESKDLLVAAYLRELAAEADREWEAITLAHPGDPAGQIKAWIALVASHLAQSDDRGCPLANAAVELPDKEHPARTVIEQHKTAQRDHLVHLCGKAGFEHPAQLADEIFLLLEGARVNVQSVGRCGPGGRFAAMACTLMASHTRTGTP
ncbi:MAG TPA: TetR/AcrR family transcriptional regulator [Rhizomicrobium sp.]